MAIQNVMLSLYNDKQTVWCSNLSLFQDSSAKNLCHYRARTKHPYRETIYSHIIYYIYSQIMWRLETHENKN